MRKYLILAMLVMVLFSGCKTKEEKKKLAEPSFCTVSEDCGLYNCSNCGNKLWIDENNQSNEGCSNRREMTCDCVENICKRVYK